MANVIKRLDKGVWNDVPSTYDEAEKICGFKLDRRKNYAIIKGEVCDAGSWTRECSGCNGGGCDECGYQGKRRESMWFPIHAKEIKK